MGIVFRPQLTRPLPRDAEVTLRDGVRTARWRTKKGTVHTAEVRTTANGERIVLRSGKFVARYRDAGGVVQTIATGCRDETAAKAKLAELQRRAELVKAGVLSATEDAVADHRRASITTHVATYISSLRARGVTDKHIRGVRLRLTTVFEQCRFRALKDINRDSFEAWWLRPENLKRSTRTRNTYLIACRSFLRWCVETERILADPLARLKKGDEKANQVRVPRALTPDEIVALLDAARRRPLHEGGLFNKGWRKGQPGACVRPETQAKLERLGWERALIYRTLVLTGLRLGELAEVRVCDLVLSGPQPHIVVEARHAKNREEARQALRADLAADLRKWVLSSEGPADRPLFAVSEGILKVFNRDLAFAGIAKHDDRGRTVCIHSLRHSLATMLGQCGVPARVAQAAMRHSSLDMTQVYTDPRLLDVGEALERLPRLSLEPSRVQGSGL